MKKVNWLETLKDWQPSQQDAKPADATRIMQLMTFCQYVGENMYEKIVFFESTLESKRHLEDDQMSKNDIFLLAAEQLGQHQKAWEVTQRKQPDLLTFEFPLALEIDNQLRYMKFQIKEGVQGLAAPSRVKRVWLRYHKSNQVEIEVQYVEE